MHMTMQLLSNALFLSCAACASAALISKEERFLHPLGTQAAASQVSFAAFRPHSTRWYKERCRAIKEKCESQEEEVERAQAQEERHLEKEYRNENRILEQARETADEERRDMREQRDVVRGTEEDLKEAKAAYDRTKDCPEEHRKLEEELRELQATPNDSEEDIDAECMKKKEILDKEKCVDDYVKAQSTLARAQQKHAEETDDFSSDKRSAEAAAQGVDPYERRANDAKDALDAERKRGATKQLNEIGEDCRRKLKELWRLSEEEVAEARQRYDNQEDHLKDGKKEHGEAKDDVSEQRQEVRDEREQVEAARKVYEAKKDCPDELARAEEELAALEGVPNESEEDIDAECQKKKQVLEKRRCVDQFVEAESVLERQESDYAGKKSELSEDKRDEKAARAAVDRRAAAAHDAKKDWMDAKDAQRALRICMAPVMNPEEEAAVARKGGGARARLATAAALLLAAVAL